MIDGLKVAPQSTRLRCQDRLAGLAEFQQQPNLAYQEVLNMLYWAAVFLVISIVAALLGFTGIAGAAAAIAKILFGIFLVLFLLFLVIGWAGTRAIT